MVYYCKHALVHCNLSRKFTCWFSVTLWFCFNLCITWCLYSVSIMMLWYQYYVLTISGFFQSAGWPSSVAIMGNWFGKSRYIESRKVGFIISKGSREVRVPGGLLLLFHMFGRIWFKFVVIFKPILRRVFFRLFSILVWTPTCVDLW
jgi:sugar phosphate permease